MSACMSRGLFGRIMSMTDGTAGDVRSEKRASITKEAKNLGRLLARVGRDLSGATARDLKFLRRRGFRGFAPEQVSMLRSRGMLPSAERELAGFNKGTENMLKWTPRPFTPEPVEPPYPSGRESAEEFMARLNAHQAYVGDHMAWKDKNFFALPAKTITRTNAAGARYGVEPAGYSRAITIPDTSAPGSLSEREIRAAIARHEAREWVRANAAYARGGDIRLPGATFPGIFNTQQVGTSHAPGVIYDERVFRSQLANRLGLGKKWSDMPLNVAEPGAAVQTRGARDVYTGNHPLGYEFKLIRDWNRLNAGQAGMIRPIVEGVRSGLASNPEMQAALSRRAGDISAVLGMQYGKHAPSPELVRQYLRDRLLFRPAYKTVERMKDSGYIPVSTPGNKGFTYLRDDLQGFGDDIVSQYYAPAVNLSGVPVHLMGDVLRGKDVVPAVGSELAKVRGMSVYPRVNGVQYNGGLFGF